MKKPSIPICDSTALPLIKVCGLNDCRNIAQVAALHPAFMGFIFWSNSVRNACALKPEAVLTLPQDIRPVGVFVNESFSQTVSTVNRYGITTIQLHGDETPDHCRRLRDMGYTVIKAIGIATDSDLEVTERYADAVDLFVLDTKSEKRGGTGKAFNHDVLSHYSLSVPYLLSGGIGPEDATATFRYQGMAGFDINSRFETVPGTKDITLLKKFFHTIHSKQKLS